MAAAISGKIEIGRLLLQSGADKTVKDSEGHTALDMAMEHQSADFVKLLM